MAFYRLKGGFLYLSEIPRSYLLFGSNLIFQVTDASIFKNSMKQRDKSIDLLKFIAVLAITNSHMDILYGKYSGLATGGAIGDVLFFFASGFTLFLGEVKSFDNYYKRRINRIYPSVFALALISCICWENDNNFVSILLFGGDWFVSCIMIYYVVLYFIRKHMLNHLNLVFCISLVISIALYWFFKDGNHYNMYGPPYYKWVHYFSFMLLGSIMGLKTKQRDIEVGSWYKEGLKVVLFVILFYALCAFKNTDRLNFLQVLSLFPLLGVVYYIYRLCNVEVIKSIYDKKVGLVLRTVGGLCLEIYLIQNYLFTDRFNRLFPLNILIVFIGIVIAAYILRCLSRIWAQTFKNEDYDWKEVFKIV